MRHEPVAHEVAHLERQPQQHVARFLDAGMRGGVEYRIPIPGLPRPFDLMFLHCNTRDHTLAFGPPGEKRINHLMLEVEDFDDVGLTYDLGLPLHFARILLHQLRPHALLPAGHELAKRPSVSLAELAAYPLITTDQPQSWQHMLDLFRGRGLSPVAANRTSSFELQRSMVANGFGVAVSYTRPRGDRSYDGMPLVCKPLSDPLPMQRIILTHDTRQRASAAALATLDTYKEEGLLTRGEELSSYWEDALHSLKGEPHVIDIRNIGLIGAVELEPIAGSPTKRAFSAFVKAFERGLLIRTTGDIIALSPPLIITKGQIDELFDHLREVLRMID